MTPSIFFEMTAMLRFSEVINQKLKCEIFLRVGLRLFLEYVDSGH